MRGLGVHLGMRRPGGGDPTLALDLSFSSELSLPSIFSGQERTGLGCMWEDDGDLGFGPHNLVYATDLVTNWSPLGDTTRATGKADPDGGTGAVEITTAAGGLSNRVRHFSGFAGIAGSITHTVKIAARSVSGSTTLSIDLGDNTPATQAITTSWATYTITVVSHATNNWLDISLAAAGVVELYFPRCARGLTAYDITTTAGARYLMRQEIHPAIAEAVRGVLGEPQVTNGFHNSRWVGGTTPTDWTLFGAAPTVETSLHGASDGAIALEFTSAAAQNFIYRAFTLANNTTYTISCLVESVTGTVTANNVLLHAGLPASCTITAWHLDGVAITASTALTPGELSFVIGGTYTGASTTFRVGLGTNAASTGTVQLSRPQIEASAYATSWIATPTGATTTRTTDPRLTYTLPAALQTALATAGTLFVECALIGAGSAAHINLRNFLTLSDTTSTNQIRIYNNTGNIGVNATSATTGSTINNGAPVEAYSLIRIAFSWNASGCLLTVNGVTYPTAGTFVGCPVTELALLGTRTGTATAGAIISRAKVYTRFMEDAEREALAHA